MHDQWSSAHSSRRRAGIAGNELFVTAMPRIGQHHGSKERRFCVSTSSTVLHVQPCAASQSGFFTRNGSSAPQISPNSLSLLWKLVLARIMHRRHVPE